MPRRENNYILEVHAFVERFTQIFGRVTSACGVQNCLVIVEIGHVIRTVPKMLTQKC